IPFILKDNLLYYINLKGNKGFYILKTCVKLIFKLIYNKKYYFSKNKIINNL
ncbi:hypothetical protein K449DRAFT_337425, partial [Hypoxylon sp. EC38]